MINYRLWLGDAADVIIVVLEIGIKTFLFLGCVVFVLGLIAMPFAAIKYLLFG